MISTSQFNDLVKNAKLMWRDGYKSIPFAARQMYDIRSVSEMTSEHSSISGYGFAERKQEGEKYAYGTIKQGYKLKYLAQMIEKLFDNTLNCGKLLT